MSENLLRKKIFFPFFITMGLGAFNDNLFKSALAIYFTYNLPAQEANQLVQLSAGLFILPFFLFSGISGQICDKYEKSSLMKNIKILEIIIMIIGATAFLTQATSLLLLSLFLMGAQSTLFGPVKYSILPQHLEEKNLLKGNAYTSMGTFLFILFGTILGGSLLSKNMTANNNYFAISMSIIIFAGFGYIASTFIPSAEAADSKKEISYNIPLQTFRTMKLIKKSSKTLESITLISWFWFFGFFFMASLPIFCRDVLKGDELSATFLLAIISIGMGVGSVIGDKLTKGNLRMGIVGISGFFLGLFAIIFSSIKANQIENIQPLTSIMRETSFITASLAIFFIGIFGGILIVPLYTQLQNVVPDKSRSQYIASNNIWNAAFMVSAAIFSMVLFALNWAVSNIFLLVSLINIFIFILYIWKNPRDFYLSFFDLLFRALYKIELSGEENLTPNGPVIIAANHISFIDPLLLCVGINRPPVFVMDQSYFDIILLRWFYKSAKAIPITPKKINPEGLKVAMEKTEDALRSGELVAIFPEGFITKDGNIVEFKDGISRLGNAVPTCNLYPVAISGMWGSWFSRYNGGKAMRGFPRRRFIRTKISVSIGAPIKGSDITAIKVQKEVTKLRGNIK